MNAAAIQIGKPFAERFTILEELGAGGAGSVYKVLDDISCEELALKVLHRDLAAKERQRLRFMREFRAISRLDHPGCLAVHEEGVWQGNHYFTMEFVPGGDMKRYVGHPPGELLDLLLGVARALAYVHGQRVVHRDLKPANVLVVERADGLVPKLADFGLAKLLETGDSLTETGAIMGTLAFMSPEQIQGLEVDARTDLYALGCMVHYLFTSRPPFIPDQSPFELIRAHTKLAPPRLAERAAVVPDGLEELTAALLAKDPADRPQSALEVADVLAAIAGGDASSVSLTLGRRAGVYRPPIVGRERVLARLRDALALMHAGGPGPCAVWLEAPAGMGKSRLVEALSVDLRDSGVGVLRVSAEESPAGLFAPFGELERLVEHRAALDQTVAADTPTLEAPPAAAAASPGAQDAAAARRLRVARFVDMACQAHADAPLALVVEDVHMLDDGAAAYLHDLARALGARQGPRPSLLLTARPTPRRLALERAPGVGARLENVDLEPLDAEAIEELLARMLGAQDADAIARLTSRIVDQTEGNPLFVQACLQGLVEQGSLRRGAAGSWEVTDTGDTTELLPDSMAQVLRERLASLSEPTYNALRAASALGRVFDFSLLREVSGLPEFDLLDAIDEALRAWIIRSIEGPHHLDVYVFDHAKLAEVLYEDLSPSRRRALHGAAARALLARDSPAATLAHHFARGDSPEDALTHIEAAGADALANHDPEAASSWLTQAIERLRQAGETEGARAARLLELAADARSALNDSPGAAALLREALGARAHDPPSHARLERKLGRALFLQGESDAGIELYHSALTRLGERPRAGRWTAVARAAWLFLLALIAERRSPATSSRQALTQRALAHRDLMLFEYWRDVVRAVLHQFAYLRLAERLREPAYQVDAYGSHLVFLGMARMDGRSRRLSERAQRMGEQTEDLVGVARLWLFRAMDAGFHDDLDGFLTARAHAVETAERAGDRFTLSFVLHSGGWFAIVLSQWDLAVDSFDRALEIGAELEDSRVRADALAGRASLGVLMGEDTLARADELGRIGRELSLAAFVALSHEIRAGHTMLHGRASDALEHFERAIAVYTENRLFGAWGFMVHFEFHECLLLALDKGQVERASAIARLAKNARAARISIKSLPSFTGIHEVMRASLASRRGKHASAQRLIRRALALREHRPDHYLTAWVTQRAALELARLGAPRDEVDALFARCDAIYEGTPAQGLRDLLAMMRALADEATR
jgi:tetratricopeptide (TPR) repeat protein